VVLLTIMIAAFICGTASMATSSATWSSATSNLSMRLTQNLDPKKVKRSTPLHRSPAPLSSEATSTRCTLIAPRSRSKGAVLKMAFVTPSTSCRYLPISSAR
jgi:hypothetical protein